MKTAPLPQSPMMLNKQKGCLTDAIMPHIRLLSTTDRYRCSTLPIGLHEEQLGEQVCRETLLYGTKLAVQNTMTWPPTVDSSTDAAGMDRVPSSLYNLLSWVVVAAARTREDVPEDREKVKIRNDPTHRQVLFMTLQRCLFLQKLFQCE